MNELPDLSHYVDQKLREYQGKTPDELRAIRLAMVNTARAEYGDPPLTRLLTPEEVEASYQAMGHPQKHSFFHRLKKAWQSLFDGED